MGQPSGNKGKLAACFSLHNTNTFWVLFSSSCSLLAPAQRHAQTEEQGGCSLLAGICQYWLLCCVLVAGGNRHWNFAKLILAENPVAYGRSECLFFGQSVKICSRVFHCGAKSDKICVFPRDYPQNRRICSGRRARKKENRTQKCTIHSAGRTLPLHEFAVLGSRRSDGSPRVYVEYWFFKEGGEFKTLNTSVLKGFKVRHDQNRIWIRRQNVGNPRL